MDTGYMDYTAQAPKASKVFTRTLIALILAIAAIVTLSCATGGTRNVIVPVEMIQTGN